MNAEAHTTGFAVDHPVDDAGVKFQQIFPVVASFRQGRLNFGIRELGEGGFVQLHVFASCIVQRRKFAVVGIDDVVPEILDVVVDDLADISRATEEMQDAGAGQGDLHRLAGQFVDEGEILVVDRMGPVNPRPDLHPRRADLLSFVVGVVPALFRIAVELEIAHPFEEMGEIRIPSVLAVGDYFQPGVFLQADHVANGQVFDLAEFLFVQLARLELDARLNELRRPQKTANMFGTKRRVDRPFVCHLSPMMRTRADVMKEAGAGSTERIYAYC